MPDMPTPSAAPYVLIDSHCHVDVLVPPAPPDATRGDAQPAASASGHEAASPPHSDTLAAYLNDARTAGLGHIVMAGVDPANWQRQRHLADTYPDLHPVLGLHPQSVALMSEAACHAALNELDSLLGDPRVVALGELGLDRLSPESKASIPLQEHIFRAQISLAKKHDKPLVLHLLRANEPALRILKSEGLPPKGGVVHSYSGAKEFAKACLDLGLHLSFAGTLTFPQSRRLRESAAYAPADRLLIETDAPFQSPVPYRGEPNRPAYLTEILKALAEVRGWSLAHCAAQTTANALRFFGLDAGPEPAAPP